MSANRGSHTARLSIRNPSVVPLQYLLNRHFRRRCLQNVKADGVARSLETRCRIYLCQVFSCEFNTHQTNGKNIQEHAIKK